MCLIYMNDHDLRVHSANSTNKCARHTGAQLLWEQIMLTVFFTVQSRYDSTQRYFGPCLESRRRRRSADGGLASDTVTDPVPEMFDFDVDFEPTVSIRP